MIFRMALTTEWRNRLKRWRDELPKHFYLPLGTVSLEGFITRERLTREEALAGDYRSMPPGTAWGGKWEYGCFRGSLVLPAEASSQRIVLRLGNGAESLVYVNGRHAGASDWAHTEITLSTSGVPGERYEILAEGYAGHGPTPCEAGPTPPGRLTVPEPPPAQKTVTETTFGIWQEEAFQLWVDVETLIQLRDLLEEDSLRVSEIDAGLRDFTTIVDFELPRVEMLATVKQCRARLKPLLDCVNGSTAPTFYTFGHSHIDVAWLWPLSETERKCLRTFSTALALKEEYPEYIFLQSQPHLYRMVKESDPELYRRITQAVADGWFIPDGGMWVEADTNITGGESLIRQFIHGKRFFREEFGVENELLWLPDVFGYSGALPQIMRGCGIKYFSTQKIYWTYNGGDPFPYVNFQWEGIDGTRILAHLHNDYNAETEPKALIRRWRERPQKDGYSTRLYPFGYGDGGGGPARKHLEFLRRQRDLEGSPRTKIAGPAEFFHDLEPLREKLPRYVGELYFVCHRGTYTSQAETKKGNRRSEFALREAEFWGTAARSLKGYAYPMETLNEAWQKVLLNQFHDIIPGSSIHRVYDEANHLYDEVIAATGDIAVQAAGTLTAGREAVTAFNSLSWSRRAMIALPAGFAGAQDERGQNLPIQMIDGESWAEATIPSCGWTTLRPAEPAGAIDNKMRVERDLLENEHLRLELNSRGELIGIFDKDAGHELAAGPCNSLKMYRDVPTFCDAWDIDSQYELCPVDLPGEASVEITAAGPLLGRLRFTRKLHDSEISQEINLRRGARRVDFRTVIDWREKHKLLKAAFPVNIHADEAVHEIQFGHIRRPTHRNRQFDADRFEVSNHKWTALMEEGRGCAVLNDCKYGVNVLGNSINLTLLKSALAPDMTADQGRHEFTYAFYAWNGSFVESNLVREGYELNRAVWTVPGAAGEASLFAIDAPNVLIETVKPAEDGSPDLIVRLYEAKRTATRCVLTTTLPVKSAAHTDMLERVEKELPGTKRIELELRPFEIVTLRLVFRS